jgi:predicted membrane protein
MDLWLICGRQRELPTTAITLLMFACGLGVMFGAGLTP